MRPDASSFARSGYGVKTGGGDETLILKRIPEEDQLVSPDTVMALVPPRWPTDKPLRNGQLSPIDLPGPRGAPYGDPKGPDREPYSGDLLSPGLPPGGAVGRRSPKLPAAARRFATRGLNNNQQLQPSFVDCHFGPPGGSDFGLVITSRLALARWRLVASIQQQASAAARVSGNEQQQSQPA